MALEFAGLDLEQLLLLVFSGIVAISTVVYAVLTWRLVSETRRMRQMQTEPRISVRPELSEHFGHGGIELVIRNEGQGPAQNIRFQFQGDPTYFDKERPVDQIPVIKNGLPYLGPNQTFRFLLGWLLGESFTHAMQKPWVFAVLYENQEGKPKKDTYVVDFSQFSQLIVGGGPPLTKIEGHLGKLQKDVRNMLTGFSPLNVITQTKKEAKKEMEEIMNQRRDSSNLEENSETE